MTTQIPTEIFKSDPVISKYFEPMREQTERLMEFPDDAEISYPEGAVPWAIHMALEIAETIYEAQESGSVPDLMASLRNLARLASIPKAYATLFFDEFDKDEWEAADDKLMRKIHERMVARGWPEYWMTVGAEES